MHSCSGGGILQPLCRHFLVCSMLFMASVGSIKGTQCIIRCHSSVCVSVYLPCKGFVVENGKLLLHYTRLMASSWSTWVSWYQKGKTSLDLNEARDDGVLEWQWHQLNHMQKICPLLQTNDHANTSSLNFYRLDAFPDAQPAVSKHRC